MPQNPIQEILEIVSTIIEKDPKDISLQSKSGDSLLNYLAEIKLSNAWSFRG